jgi:hypothetical protein
MASAISFGLDPNIYKGRREGRKDIKGGRKEGETDGYSGIRKEGRADIQEGRKEGRKGGYSGRKGIKEERLEGRMLRKHIKEAY